MISSNICNETERNPREDLPNFLREPDGIDRILYASLMLVAMYGLVIIPFRAVLLPRYTFLHVWLTDSNLSVLIFASESEDRPLFLFTVVAIAVLSTIKFMPLFYRTGKKWGPELITMNFGGHPPRWFEKIENFIYERIGLSILASFVSFSSVPATIVVVINGIVKVHGWVVGVYLFLCAAMFKCLYLYLGLIFGLSIQGSLQTIDRYVTHITLALIDWMFLSIWWKNRKPSGQVV